MGWWLATSEASGGSFVNDWTDDDDDDDDDDVDDDDDDDHDHDHDQLPNSHGN